MLAGKYNPHLEKEKCGKDLHNMWPSNISQSRCKPVSASTGRYIDLQLTTSDLLAHATHNTCIFRVHLLKCCSVSVLIVDISSVQYFIGYSINLLLN